MHKFPNLKISKKCKTYRAEPLTKHDHLLQQLYLLAEVLEFNRLHQALATNLLRNLGQPGSIKAVTLRRSSFAKLVQKRYALVIVIHHRLLFDETNKFKEMLAILFHVNFFSLFRTRNAISRTTYKEIFLYFLENSEYIPNQRKILNILTKKSN